MTVIRNETVALRRGQEELAHAIKAKLDAVEARTARDIDEKIDALQTDLTHKLNVILSAVAPGAPPFRTPLVEALDRQYRRERGRW